MAKKPNPTDSETLRITVSKQSARLLEELAAKGLWGRNSAEVAGRFVDLALHEFVERPVLRLDDR